MVAQKAFDFFTKKRERERERDVCKKGTTENPPYRP